MAFNLFEELPTCLITEQNYNVLAKMDDGSITFAVEAETQRSKSYFQDIIIALGGSVCDLVAGPTLIIVHGKLLEENPIILSRKESVLTSEFVLISAKMNKLAKPSDFRYFPNISQKEPSGNSGIEYEMTEDLCPIPEAIKTGRVLQKDPYMPITKGAASLPVHGEDTSSDTTCAEELDTSGENKEMDHSTFQPDNNFETASEAKGGEQASKPHQSGACTGKIVVKGFESKTLPTPQRGALISKAVINTFLDEIKSQNLYDSISGNNMYTKIIQEQNLQVRLASIRNFFLRTFPKNLEKFCRTPEETTIWQNIYKPKQDVTKKYKLRPFTKKEGHFLLKLILDANAENYVYGNAIYPEIAKQEIFKNRPWSSIRNFMIKTALQKLETYEEFKDEFGKYKTMLALKQNLRSTKTKAPQAVIDKLRSANK